MEGEECQGGWLIKGKWAKLTSNMYAVFEFLVHYIIHITALVFLYGKVINTSKKTLNKLESTTSAATQKVIFSFFIAKFYSILLCIFLLKRELFLNIPGFVCRNKSCYRCYYYCVHIDIQLDVLVNTFTVLTPMYTTMELD